MKQSATATPAYLYADKKTQISAEEKESRKESRKELILITVISVLMAPVFFAGLFLAGRFGVNEFYNAAYRRGYFLNRQATATMKPARPEGFVQYYNTGNNHFKNGAYEEAMNAYTLALEQEPFHVNGERAESENTGENDIDDPECRIRINLALSVLYQIDFENLHINDRVEVDQAAEMLLMARKTLTDGYCAHFTDTGGHNAYAEELKKEIDELLKRLNRKPPQEEEQQQQQQQQDEQEEKQDKNDSQTQREKEIQRKLEEEMKNAKEEQAEAQRNRDRNGYGYDNQNGQNW